MFKNNQGKLTTKDLARICKVSLGTIDRAFHDKPGISSATKKRILETAESMGYRPNHIGRSLQSGRTFEIGLVVHDLDNRFFSQLVNVIQQVAWEHGYYIQLAISLRDSEREYHIMEHMLQRNVDGILLFPANKDRAFAQFLHELDKPIVLMANKIDESVGVSWPFVGLNNRDVVREAIERIISKGYETIYFVAPFFDDDSHNYYEIKERYRAFLEVVDRHGIKHREFLNQDYLEDIAALKLPGKSAFFCVSDIFALEVYNLILGSKLRIPQDVGVMGFDDIDILKYISPALSTIKYPVSDMGEQAFHILNGLITGKRADTDHILEAEIIWRESI